MKLYTREQVIEAMTKCFLGHSNMEDYDYELEYSIIEQLTPIELPSDEEIEKEFTIIDTTYPHMIAGAKWLKEQILNQNK